MIRKIPFILIYSRLLCAVIILIVALSKIENYQIWIVSLTTFGLITDVFDGIIARRLNVSSEKLRVWDSNVDQIFWLLVIFSIFFLNFEFVMNNIVLL